MRKNEFQAAHDIEEPLKRTGTDAFLSCLRNNAVFGDSVSDPSLRIHVHITTAALGVLTIGFFLVLVIINGFIGNWLLQQGSSDSFVGSVFFSPAPDPYTSWPYRESYLPLEAVGQAVEFASKVAEDLTSSSSQSGNEKDKGIISFLHSKGYDPEASETSYRMARPKAGRTRGSRRRRVKKQVSRFLNHFVLGISMTGIGSFLWLILTLPLW